MKSISDAVGPIWQAMAGGKSPWGGGTGKDPDGGDKAASGPESDDSPADSSGDKEGGDKASEPNPPSGPPPGPRNPWISGGDGKPPRRSASMDDILRARIKTPGGSGGGSGRGGLPPFPRRPDGRSWLPIMAAGVVGLWLLMSTAHMLGSNEQGLVSTFGRYSRPIYSGVSLTLPWPIETVTVEDVTSIRRESIPEGEAEKLMLTSDQNLVDISYIVRWNIKDLKLYTFQLDDPEDTVKEVAEAAMRASIAEVPLKAAMGGEGRAYLEPKTRERMQAVLDAYRSGVLIQGVEIKKANPPAKVNDAFQKVSAAQQEANRDISNANAWAQQVTARAQGDSAAFDKVYAQYKLAPDVTRRRMYYETMERVLSANDKVILQSSGVNTYLPLPEIKQRAAAPPKEGQ